MEIIPNYFSVARKIPALGDKSPNVGNLAEMSHTYHSHRNARISSIKYEVVHFQINEK